MRFFNSLTKRLEDFVPGGPEVGLYTCGPTVYDFAHIGNYRAYVWEDVLKRALVHRGFRVRHVMNLTDVDDKTIRNSSAEGIPLDRYTARFIQAFYEDLDALRIARADAYPRATEHVPEMVDLVSRLIERGHTYTSQGSIYFRIATFPRYGRLSGVDLAGMRDGARVDSDEYEKEDVKDFVLWKGWKEGEPGWESPLGKGRPGWHIECSAMSMKYLGETFDIHTGGVDNMFPHHENEIAQSECATGKPFVRTWLHCAHLMVNGEKMAKSKGNFYTLRDLLEKGQDARAIRYLLLSVQYRKPLNFTFEGITAARSSIGRLDDFTRRLRTERFPEGRDEGVAAQLLERARAFDEALDDDLNVSGALGALFDLVRDGNAALDGRRFAAGNRDEALAWLRRADSVLGVLNLGEEGATDFTFTSSAGRARRIVADFPLPEDVRDAVRAREEARAGRDFAAADRVRGELLSRDFVLEDTPDGVRVKRK